MRGADWRVRRCRRYADCEALELASATSATHRTLLVPFDRPRRHLPARPAVVSRRRWFRNLGALLRSSFDSGGLQFCPAAIRLLPYQLEPALAVLRYGVVRLLVADDVGLGKTVEAGLIVRELAAGDRLSRTLVLCPGGLRAQWAGELRTLFALEPIEADAAWLRRSARELPADVNPWSVPGVYLSSMDFIKRPEALRPLEDLRWDLLVVDEAHAATPGTQRRAAVHALALRSHRVVLLTATPHSGDPDAFASLCSIGTAAAAEDPIVVFNRSRADTPLGDTDVRSRILHVRCTRAERELHRLVDAYATRVWNESSVRRDVGGELLAAVLKKRSLSSAASLRLSVSRRLAFLRAVSADRVQLLLPLQAREEQALESQDDGCELLLAGRGLDDEGEERGVLARLAAAADAVSRQESKVRVLLRLLRRVREPAIVFSEYRDTAAQLRDALQADGRPVCLLHGGLSGAERRDALVTFAAGGHVLVATDTASEGLNLHQTCRLVVHFELPWTPVRLQQRCGRVHRIGQARRVHEIALVASDTAERTVLLPLIMRARRARGFARGRIVEQLSEGAVARHVLGGEPFPQDDQSVPPLPPFMQVLPLGEEGRIEAARLQTLRRLSESRYPRRAPRHVRAAVPVLRLKRTGAQRLHVHIIVSLWLRDGHGLLVDHQIVGLSFATRDRWWSRRRAPLRAQVNRLLDLTSTPLMRIAHELIAERRRRIHPLLVRRVTALAHRDAAMERTLPSVAPQLVQPGLFDRRAIRAAAARARALQVRKDDEEGRYWWRSQGVLTQQDTVTVRAILIGRPL